MLLEGGREGSPEGRRENPEGGKEGSPEGSPEERKGRLKEGGYSMWTYLLLKQVIEFVIAELPYEHPSRYVTEKNMNFKQFLSYNNNDLIWLVHLHGSSSSITISNQLHSL